MGYKMSISHDLLRSIMAIHKDLADFSNSWAASIAFILLRMPFGVTYGEASRIAGGGWSPDLRFCIAMYWSPEVLHCHDLPSSPAYY